jgi:hypothetical protein
MVDTKWKDSEKKLARKVFDAALQRELAEVMGEFKARAANVRIPEEMWTLEDFLARSRRAIDAKYDFRYSQLLRVFGVLVREKRVPEEELAGLSAEKLDFIRG